MSTHNACFHAELRKKYIFFFLSGYPYYLKLWSSLLFWFVIWVGGFMPQWAPFCAEYMSGRKKASQVWKTFSTRNFRQPQIQSKFLIYINIYVCKNARIGKTGKLVWTRPSPLYGKLFQVCDLDLKVYKAALARNKLWTSNWHHCKYQLYHPGPSCSKRR